MAEEAISTAILTVATIIAALVLVNAMYPSLYSASGSILSMNDRTADRIRTDLTVLTEWYPLSHPADDIRLEAWIKNTGSTTITEKDLGNSDVFLDTGNHMSVRIPERRLDRRSGERRRRRELGADRNAPRDGALQPGRQQQRELVAEAGIAQRRIRGGQLCLRGLKERRR